MALTTQFPRGSEWRKWDLHVHVPSVGGENRFEMLPDGQPDWPRYCDLVETSDVAVFGITDYFSLDRLFDFVAAHKLRHPDSRKIFLPSMEVRLNEAVNGAGEEVNLHLVFPESLSRDDADRFMRALHTELQTVDHRPKACRDLVAGSDFASATVTRANITSAIEDTFGKRRERQDSVMIVTSCKGDGIRPKRGAMRKENLTDEIDKLSDSFFGRSSSVAHFLSTERLENKADTISPKPVFSGCDAHTFADLEDRLGREVNDGSHQTEVTWVKADPGFEGLRQTLAEPRDRVRIQVSKPDTKEPYKYISRVTFSDGALFPDEVLFNSNLCTVIGSRSSGKSALLAYIAHAVDPDHTVAQQLAANVPSGPAAGLRWSDVPEGVCTVEWGDPAAAAGQVIYIPQNSLFAISERPQEITQKIRPALYREDPDFESVQNHMMIDVRSANEAVGLAVREWFRLVDSIAQSQASLNGLGDREGVASVRDDLAGQIVQMRADSALTDEETTAYQQVMSTLSENANRSEAIEESARRLAPYVTRDDAGAWVATDQVAARVDAVPPATSFPGPLGEAVTSLVDQASASVTDRLRELLAEHRAQLETEREALQSVDEVLRAENEHLIRANQANTELDTLVRRHQTQVETLKSIDESAASITVLKERQSGTVETIKAQLGVRASAVQRLVATFAERDHLLDELKLGIEAEVDEEALIAVSQDLHRQSRSEFLDSDKNVDLAAIEANPAGFLSALASGEQKIRQGRSAVEIAVAALQITPEVRFCAELDGDRIGGFQVSTMTPGKQALFALSLILNETSDRWPLLIDQPEDDLDSRSIFEQIVPYLVKRKSDRQIIMVTHDANLAVGADSEQIIVANRHGDDRPNRRGRTFDYVSGSLEHSSPMTAHREALKMCGIREHACLILDGGETAFRKRKQKYQI